jgi:glyceraldehyde-3-phosphate dehydrogenase/erythrose-4-phosphate dehydrogenase
MAVRVGINGFGRIGRNIMRATLGTTDIDFVAINDLTNSKTLAHLLKYDSVLGNLQADVKATDTGITVDGDEFTVLSMKDPAQLPWKDLGVDVVFESTGIFTDRDGAAALSMIPTTTGAALAVGEVLPELKGKLDGFSMRVPTPNVSVVDLSALVEKKTTGEEINAALREAADGPMKGILSMSDDPLVSIDFRGNPHSSIIDSAYTKVMDGDLVKVVSWYDNEWGYSNRCVDLLRKVVAAGL